MAKQRPPLVCTICEDADNYGEPDACPCTAIAVVQQTMEMAYEDGSTAPYTDIIVLCLECRVTFYAWGDTIVQPTPTPRDWAYVDTAPGD